MKFKVIKFTYINMQDTYCYSVKGILKLRYLKKYFIVFNNLQTHYYIKNIN